MKRIDHILKIALGNLSEEKEDISSCSLTKPAEQKNFGTEPNLQQNKDNVLQVASLMPIRNMDKNKGDVDSLVAPVYAPLTPLAILNNDTVGMDVEAASLVPIRSIGDKDDVDSPAAPAYSPLAPLAALDKNCNSSSLVPVRNIMDKNKDDVDSLAASVYAPLIPLAIFNDETVGMDVEAASLVRNRSIMDKDDVDSPAAPPYSPLTPLAALDKNCNSSSLVPVRNIMDKNKDELDSLDSPVYAPLIPLANFNDDTVGMDVEAASLVPIRSIGDKDDVDSPAAVAYSPLTPLAALDKNCNSKEYFSRGHSPLPTMSPSTLESYENLSKTFRDFETEEVMNELQTISTEIMTRNLDENEQSDFSPNMNEQSDFSPDTSSDYVPNTDEDTDDEVILHRPRRILTTAMIHNSKTMDPKPNSNVTTKTITSNEENCIVTEEEAEINFVNNETSTQDLTNCTETQDVQQTSNKGRTKRGRKRKYAEHTISQKKERKYANLSYATKNKIIEPKDFIDKNCTCKKKCSELIPFEKRKEEFSKYILLGSYEAQVLYILKNVKEVPKKRKYTTINSKTGKNKPKEYHRTYTICDQKVCKEMFLNTFQVTGQKITTCLQKQRAGTIINDQRGVSRGGWNKTPDEDVEFIKNIINALPKYESHYRRDKNSHVLYLQPGIIPEKIYAVYIEELKKVYGEDKKCVSLATLKRIFYNNFNLRCKVLKKDTCNRCDVYDNKIKNARSAEEKEQLAHERDEHQKRAEELRACMTDDLKRAKNDESFECLTFDLEKTLPLPRLSTSIIFYKRQLWFYNSGIHAGSNDSGHCYVWVEGEAGRGAQEVGSCLIKFLKTNLDSKVENLVLWSDCCGGQNRNIKIVLMLKAILNSHPNLQKISLKYLESGHTWLPNDTDFSKIEFQLKYHERIYTANEYIKVIKSCKKVKPLQVYKMEKHDFLGIKKIEKNIVNRKTFISKQKVNWLKTKEILIKKEEKQSIYMRSSFTEEFNELNIEKKLKGKSLDVSENDFVVLWPDGKEIAQAKLDDLKSMYDLIPSDCIDFYKSLKGNINITDDVDGFGGEPDFEISSQPQEDSVEW